MLLTHMLEIQRKKREAMRQRIAPTSFARGGVRTDDFLTLLVFGITSTAQAPLLLEQCHLRRRLATAVAQHRDRLELGARVARLVDGARGVAARAQALVGLRRGGPDLEERREYGLQHLVRVGSGEG